MHRLMAGAAALLLLATTPALAGDGAAKTAAAGKTEAKAAAAKPMTVQGEIVEMGCYLTRGATGADHKACATKCIAAGAPIGVLTGEGQVYLLTVNPADAAAFAKAKSMPAEMVTVTGDMNVNAGIKSIQVQSVETAAATKAEPATKKQG